MRGVEAVWAAARGERTGQVRSGLSLERVVAAAIEIADADGLSAVSMSRVAKRLGFTTMSLYRYVSSKEELILHMQDAVGGPPDAFDAVGSQGWRADLERWAWAVLGTMRAHPWMTQTISMLGPPATPNQLAWFDRGLATLGSTGLPEGDKVLTMLLVQAHVFGDLLFTAAENPSMPGAVGTDDYERLLARFLDPERFPALLGAFAGGGFESSPDPAADRDEYFGFGLTLILDGVERRIAAAAAERR